MNTGRKTGTRTGPNPRSQVKPPELCVGDWHPVSTRIRPDLFIQMNKFINNEQKNDKSFKTPTFINMVIDNFFNGGVA